VQLDSRAGSDGDESLAVFAWHDSVFEGGRGGENIGVDLLSNLEGERQEAALWLVVDGEGPGE
jgi:hypothetical protein